MIMTELKTVKPKEDMTGWKMWEHGIPGSRLTVIEQVNDCIISGVYFAAWLCECACGTRKVLERTDRKNTTK